VFRPVAPITFGGGVTPKPETLTDMFSQIRPARVPGLSLDQQCRPLTDLCFLRWLNKWLGEATVALLVSNHNYEDRAYWVRRFAPCVCLFQGGRCSNRTMGRGSDGAAAHMGHLGRGSGQHAVLCVCGDSWSTRAQGQRRRPRASPPRTPQSAVQELPSCTVTAPRPQQCFRKGLGCRNDTPIGQKSHGSICAVFEVFELPQHTTERRRCKKYRFTAGMKNHERIALSVKVGGVVRWGIQMRSGVVEGLHTQRGSKT